MTVSAENIKARHAEIAKRYAWHAKRSSNGRKPNKTRLVTLVRIRELERIFQHRYGRFLPADDAGLDDLSLAAHHIAHLGGEVVTYIVAWAKVWAPWLSRERAEHLAADIAASPQKFTASVLAWRLRLTAAERSQLKITTIRAFDVSEAEMAEERKRKDRERKQAKRAQACSGRPRGRPRKIRPQQIRVIIAADAFSDRIDYVSTPSETSATERAVTKPPAFASGTHPKTILVGRVDGAAVVGSPIQQRRFKTRFPTAMRLDKEMAAYALAVAFGPQQVENIFETFRNWSLAVGAYSFDWREAWFAWVDREVEYDTERYYREKRLTYFKQRGTSQWA